MISSDEQTNRDILIKNLKKLNHKLKHDAFILLDADRTIYEVDSSRILNKHAGIRIDEIKRCFVNGYDYHSFYKMAKIYSKIKKDEFLRYCKSIASNINLYDGVKEFIQSMVNVAEIIIVSSGIKQILEFILQKNDLHEIPIIGGIHKDLDDYIIGRNEKGFICKYFKSLNGTVFAFGDTDVDTLMLQKADHAIIVVNHRNNWDLLPKIQYHPSLFQISFKNYFHPRIKRISFRNCKKIFINLVNR
ncbi:MAG: HAD family hydrolase [Promethearchaeota archaeon]